MNDTLSGFVLFIEIKISRFVEDEKDFGFDGDGEFGGGGAE